MLKVREPIRVGISRKGLISSPPLNTGGIEVGPMSGVGPMRFQVGMNSFFRIILASGKPGLAGHPNTGNTPKNIFVLTSWKSQGFYLRQATFVQLLHLTQSITSPNQHFFHQPALRDPCHDSGGRKSSQLRAIISVHFGLIRESLNDQGLGQLNIPVVSEYGVDTYFCRRNGTIQLRGRGVLD